MKKILETKIFKYEEGEGVATVQRENLTNIFIFCKNRKDDIKVICLVNKCKQSLWNQISPSMHSGHNRRMIN